MHDHDPIDFEMTDLPTRPGPCRKAAAEETDATAAALAVEVEAAPHIAEAVFCGCGRPESTCDKRRHACSLTPAQVASEQALMRATRGWACDRAVEVKHGSGKVKV
jgi:hypothetical protein